MNEHCQSCFPVELTALAAAQARQARPSSSPTIFIETANKPVERLGNDRGSHQAAKRASLESLPIASMQTNEPGDELDQQTDMSTVHRKANLGLDLYVHSFDQNLRNRP